MEALNRFIKGIRKFRDYSLYEGQEWTFPTRNIRVSDYEDKGLVVTFVRGNTDNNTANGEHFSLKENYVPIGSSVYNGVLYIISVDITTPGKTEIGTYPSPKCWTDPILHGFERVYKPLKNFVLNSTSTRIDLTTTLFNYSTENMVDIVIKEIYDGSVNLYLADHSNPNLVINSGFTQEGYLGGKVINEYEFGGALNLLPTASSYIKTSLGEVENGGRLAIGMYHFYFRYSTESFNKTGFFGKLFPVQVFMGSNGLDIEGGFEIDQDGISTLTDKKVHINFDTSSLSKGYKYVQVAVVRFSEAKDGAPYREVYLIDKYYHIDNLSDGIWVLGNEPKIAFTFEEIITSVSKFPICKTQAIVDSRYYGANWKSVKYNKQKLAEHASLITLDYASSDAIDDADKIESHTAKNYQHKIYALNNNVTYKLSGHFRGEIYPYAVKYLMDDGSTTEAFPVEGKYLRNPMAATIPTNNKGLFCFPYYNNGYAAYDATNGTTFAHVNDRNRALGITFNNTNAVTFYNNNLDIFKHVKGVIYLRGDRFENLLYQGVGSNVLKGCTLNSSDEFTTGGGAPLVTFKEEKKIPWFTTNTGSSSYRNFPYISVGLAYTDSQYEDYRLTHAISLSFNNDFKSLFAPDFLFNKNKYSENGTVYVERTIVFNNPSSILTHTAGGGSSELISRIYAIEYENNDGVAFTKDFSHVGTYLQSNINFIELGVNTGYNGFSSKTNLSEAPGEPNILFWKPTAKSGSASNTRRYVGNTGMLFSKYIGLALSNTNANNFTGNIVSVFKYNDPLAYFNSIVSTIKISGTYYYEISSNFIITTDTSSTKLYKGDCFLQRVYFRQSKAYDMGRSFSEDLWDSSGNYNYQYGLLLSGIFEMTTNVAMRSQVEHITDTAQFNYTYYPRLITEGTLLSSFVYDPRSERTLYEALYVNKGFNEISNTDATLGFNSLIPSSVENRPSRIYFSPKSVAGNIRDYFRDIGPLSYRDFPLENRSVVKILNINGSLISVQEKSINLHVLGAQKLSSEGSSSEIVLKETGIYLSDKITTLAKYGSQHQWSITYLDNLAFGVDFERRIIWMIGSQKNQYTGRYTYDSKDITEETFIDGWIKDYFDSFDPFVDAKFTMKDNPINGEGIVSGFSARYKEAYFTFHFKKELGITYSDPTEWSTEVSFKYGDIVKNVTSSPTDIEAIFYFTGLSSYSNNPPPVDNTESIFWMRININSYKKLNGESIINRGDLVRVDDYTSGYIYISPVDNPSSEQDLFLPPLVGHNYSNRLPITIEIEDLSETIVYDSKLKSFITNYDLTPSLYIPLGLSMFNINVKRNSTEDRNLVFLQDNSNSDIGRFFGEKYEGVLSFIVTGGKALDVIKDFSNYIIDTSPEEFSSIEFFTDYGSSKIDPFISTDVNKSYLIPEYLENMWRGPIENNQVKEAYYDLESSLKGTWLKITVKYNSSNPKYIRKVITEFTQSFI